MHKQELFLRPIKIAAYPAATFERGFLYTPLQVPSTTWPAEDAVVAVTGQYDIMTGGACDRVIAVRDMIKLFRHKDMNLVRIRRGEARIAFIKTELMAISSPH